jgi:prevent-host-death family protein
MAHRRTTTKGAAKGASKGVTKAATKAATKAVTKAATKGATRGAAKAATKGAASTRAATTARTATAPGGDLLGALPRGVRVQTIPATQAQNAFGRVLSRAVAGHDIVILRHHTAQAVVISAERYRTLVAHEAPTLGGLSAEFEALYASMQTDAVRDATARALDASPAELGRAAVAAARRVPT